MTQRAGRALLGKLREVQGSTSGAACPPFDGGSDPGDMWECGGSRIEVAGGDERALTYRYLVAQDRTATLAEAVSMADLRAHGWRYVGRATA